MRIIGGKFRGTKLYSLEGDNTRPTLDRVKESLFNIIQFELAGSVFLDLFAGSGQIGIEALSRGAKLSIFCDKSKDAIKIIKKNIEKSHMESSTQVYNLQYSDLIKNILKRKRINIVYIDPPYNTYLAYDSIKLLLEHDIINDNSIIIVETDNLDVIENIDELKNKFNLEIYDKRKYGRAYLLFLRYMRKE